MDLVDNPYSPGAGLRPAVLAGRQDELDTFAAIMRRGELGQPARGLILTGLRGVGKTVLLNEMASRAADRDWIIAQLEVRPDGSQALLSTLAALITAGIRRQQGTRLSDVAKRALHSIKAFSLTVDPDGKLGATIDVDAHGSGDLEIDFAALAVDTGRAALEFGTGIAVFIDELQELDRTTMASLAAAAHAAGQRNVPFAVVSARGPAQTCPASWPTPSPTRSDCSTTAPWARCPMRRRRWRSSARPRRSGWPGTPQALAHVIGAADGYPYFLQEFGAAAWNSSAGPDIDAHDAGNGVRARPGHPRQRLLPLALGPGHRHRAPLPAGHGRRRRRQLAHS